MTDGQRATSLDMQVHLKWCARCRRRYYRFETHRFCPAGRDLWARFREAWTMTDDASRAIPRLREVA